MGLYEDFQAERKRRQPQELAWPVGAGAMLPFEGALGHDASEFSPEEYGDYVATSNEVFSAAMLRARLMASLSLRLYDRDGPERAEVLDGPAHDLLRHVNPFWTRRRLNLMDELSMCLWGETVWAIERRNGQPAEIWWLKPSRVHPVPHESEYFDPKNAFIYESVTGQPIPFKANEIVWFRYPNPLDEFAPLSPLAAARLAADTASAMMQSNRNLFSQGLQMGGFVVPEKDKVTFSQGQAEDLERLIDKRFRGVDKAHKWAVLRFEAQFKQMQMTPKDAEFANGLNLTLRQVANAYGIPVTLLNDLQNATLTNAREHERLLWAHALVPDSSLKAEEIVEQLLPMFRRGPEWAEFDYTKIPALQESASEGWLRERQAIEVGALTINEWRRSKGMPPVDWGDVYWRPVNKEPVVDGEPIEPDPEPGAEPGALPPEPTADRLTFADFVSAAFPDSHHSNGKGH